MWALVLAGVVVGDPCLGNDRVRLPDNSLVSAVAAISASGPKRHFAAPNNTMRFVQIKSVEQQGQLMLHRARDLLMRQRTQLINALRAHMAELGIVAAQGREGVKELLKIIATEQDARLPVDAHTSLVVLAGGLQALQTMIRSIERRIIAQHRSDEASKRLRSIPGIGIVGATAIAALRPTIGRVHGRRIELVSSWPNRFPAGRLRVPASRFSHALIDFMRNADGDAVAF